MIKNTKLATAIAVTCSLLAGATFAKPTLPTHYKMTTKEM
jgi:hypothetical protein